MTGFGRTGTMFASERVGVAPDFICLSKGLTGGFLPMSVTVCREEIYREFLGPTFERALAHGHSFTANPLGCAAALASLEVFEEEKSLEKVAASEAIHRARLARIAGLPKVARPRVLGDIAAFDIEVGDAGYGAAVGKQLKEWFFGRKLLVRPLGNVVYMMPPYCISATDLNRAWDAVEEAVRTAI
jgi:adenosylmethionine-8-amino-7-oxononanoate aminotransferase